jgi:hypothetical protein
MQLPACISRLARYSATMHTHVFHCPAIFSHVSQPSSQSVTIRMIISAALHSRRAHRPALHRPHERDVFDHTNAVPGSSCQATSKQQAHGTAAILCSSRMSIGATHGELNQRGLHEPDSAGAGGAAAHAVL